MPRSAGSALRSLEQNGTGWMAPPYTEEAKRQAHELGLDLDDPTVQQALHELHRKKRGKLATIAGARLRASGNLSSRLERVPRRCVSGCSAGRHERSAAAPSLSAPRPPHSPQRTAIPATPPRTSSGGNSCWPASSSGGGTTSRMSHLGCAHAYAPNFHRCADTIGAAWPGRRQAIHPIRPHRVMTIAAGLAAACLLAHVQDPGAVRRLFSRHEVGGRRRRRRLRALSSFGPARTATAPDTQAQADVLLQQALRQRTPAGVSVMFGLEKRASARRMSVQRAKKR